MKLVPPIIIFIENDNDVMTCAVTCSDPVKPEQNDDEALLIQTSIIDQGGLLGN